MARKLQQVGIPVLDLDQVPLLLQVRVLVPNQVLEAEVLQEVDLAVAVAHVKVQFVHGHLLMDLHGF